jgi:hypothetical protein
LSSGAQGAGGEPTALDNGQRSPRNLLAAVVRRIVVALERT